jgi:hypothetical protein
MRQYKNLLRMLKNAYRLLFDQIRRSRELLSTDNDEVLKRLLSTEKERMQFEREVEELLKSNKTTKDIDINGKKFTISV